VKDLKNHRILKDATMWDYYAQTSGRDNIKVEQNLRRREYATVNRECSKDRKSFTKETEACCSNTTITTPTPDIIRRPGAKPQKAIQRQPTLANRLVGEGFNEPPNSQGCNQYGIVTHKEGGETVLTWNEIHTDGNTPLLLENAVRKGKALQRKPRHWGQTPQSQHRHQMLVGDLEQTSTKRPKGCLSWQMVWWVKGTMNHSILKVENNVGLLRTHTRGRGNSKVERNSRR
jgi:hypothetical protein